MQSHSSSRTRRMPPCNCFLMIAAVSFLLLSSFSSSLLTNAFVSKSTSTTKRIFAFNGLDSPNTKSSTSRLYVLNNVLGSDGELYFDDEKEQLEAERQRLMRLMANDGATASKNTAENHELLQETTSSSSSSSTTTTTDKRHFHWNDQIKSGTSSPPPPLTAVGRERLRTEMKLLESLKTSDKAIGELWKFWYNARGKVKTAALVMAGEYSQEQDKWGEAEQILRDLIQEEGIYWVEPINRLATLLFYQGRYAEAKELCEWVLQVKPWHFGCQTGIVTVCEQLKDNDGIALWAGQRMPPLDRTNEQSNISREEWVDQMLQRAQKMLDDGEQTLKDSFSDNAWE